ncbi:MAG: sensor histidine kinase [Prevotella sp.]|nr:sensor histidine kinase [Prevotella sp.]
MVYAFVVALVAAIVLAYALYTQNKASAKQAEEQQRLLDDYQQRVNEQQKLLEDYRALEKNFDNVGEGYEQALLAFDKMNEEQDKARAANEALQNTVQQLQEANNQLQQDAQKKAEAMKQVVSDLMATGDQKLAALAGKISDLDEIQPNQAPFERTDNIMVAQVAEEAVRQSGIDQAQYIKFNQTVDPAAAATMMSTNLQKAARSLVHVLDNALKFTTEGSVTLAVTVDMDKMQAIYTVEDTGSGIEADDAEKVFEPYVKLNQFFDGQGIGLTVARNIARRLGGDLVLDTAFAGSGARFVLSLPI